MSVGTVVTSCTLVVDAIQRNFKGELGMPKNGTEKQKRVLDAFARQGWPNAVGIIDVTKVPCVVPTHVRQNGNADAYKERKGQTGLAYQAVVAPDTSFLSFAGGDPASVYDTKVLDKSSLRKDMHLYLDGDKYLMGDRGYALRTWM